METWKVFALGDRTYEAVPFVKFGESCTGDEMIARTDGENGGGIGKEDGEHISECLADLPGELNTCYGLVATKWQGGARCVQIFYRRGIEWRMRWRSLTRKSWDSRFLVLRRIA